MFSHDTRLFTARITVSIACLAGIPSLVSWGQDTAATAQPTEDDFALQNGLDQFPPELSKDPDDIEALLREQLARPDAVFPVGPLTPLHSFWDEGTLRSEQLLGLDLGMSYTMVYQRASSTVAGPKDATGGDWDFFGSWQICESDHFGPTQIFFNSELRHRLSSIPPASLTTGTVGGTILTFNTQDYSLPELYWEQGQYENGFITRVGKMDPFLIYDGGRYVTPNYAFLSPAFSDTLPMPLPPAALGVVEEIYLTKETYIIAGIHDANGDRTTAGFDTFFGEGEYFTAVEFGWFPNRRETTEGLYHVTLWNIDSRRNAGRPSDRGVALTLEQQFGRDGNLVPFLRYAYADRGLKGIRQNVSLGTGIEDVFGQNEDVIGVAFSCEEPSNRVLRDQYVVEAFYRFHITPHTHLTPDIQVVIDPANAPSKDAVTVFGLRLRTLY